MERAGMSPLLVTASASGSSCLQVASYEFTTLTCVPGVVRYRGAKIQLLDLPGIIEGAKDGKGRGRQVSHGLQTLPVLLLTIAQISSARALPPLLAIRCCNTMTECMRPSVQSPSDQREHPSLTLLSWDLCRYTECNHSACSNQHAA